MEPYEYTNSGCHRFEMPSADFACQKSFGANAGRRSADRIGHRWRAPGDFEAFCRQTGHVLLESSEADGVFKLVLKHK